jgi:four helix bundle protein
MGYLFAFEKLDVWKESRSLTGSIYKITNDFHESEKFGLVTQMRRAAISVCSNIAEGSSRISPKDQAHFYQLSFSSLMELLNQCIICSDLELISVQKLNDTRNHIEKIAKMLNALRTSRLSK